MAIAAGRMAAGRMAVPVELTLNGKTAIALYRALTSLKAFIDFEWSSVKSGCVVDVGGGVGSTSAVLAKEYKDMNIVVQDRHRLIDASTEIDKLL